MVKPAEAEKNLAWEAAQAAKQAAPTELELAALALAQADAVMPAATPAAAAAAAGSAGPLRLQVSGFKQGLGENEIRQIFEPFGALDSVSVVRDASGQPISVAYVVFRSAVDGRNAMTHWHGQSLLDHVLAVTATGADAAADGSGAAVGVGELDDDDGGLKINAQVSTEHQTAAQHGVLGSCDSAEPPGCSDGKCRPRMSAVLLAAHLHRLHAIYHYRPLLKTRLARLTQCVCYYRCVVGSLLYRNVLRS
jgi:hypothetical protein